MLLHFLLQNITEYNTPNKFQPIRQKTSVGISEVCSNRCPLLLLQQPSSFYPGILTIRTLEPLVQMTPVHPFSGYPSLNRGVK